MKFEFPLRWPPSQPRTKHPMHAQFRMTPGAARDELVEELKRLGASDVVITSNVPLRRDGTPYADGDPDDPAVCVYFKLAHGGPDAGPVQHEIACDAWRLVHDNMRAIGKTVEAIRGIRRWGASQLMARVMSAFRMLPAANGRRPWHEVLCVSPTASAAEIRAAHRAQALLAHPDRGGSHDRMAEINAALAEAERMGLVA